MDLMTNIRKSSATLHSAAEHSGFIKRIVDGNASEKVMLNTYLIYQLCINV